MKDIKINDIDTYNAKMGAAILDKLWFLPHVTDAKLLVDFGCADGALIRHIADLFPDMEMIGYDIDRDMVLLAQEQCSDLPNVTFTTDWEVVRRQVELTKMYDGKSCLVLSSVIHEVYNYALNKDEIETFWEKVLKTDFDYIASRDMIPQERFLKAEGVLDEDGNFTDNFNSLANRVAVIHNAHPALTDYKGTKDFGLHSHHLLDYLLHYQFHDSPNWEDEVKETYSVSTFHRRVTPQSRATDNDYVVELDIEYTLPYLRRMWEKEFRFSFQFPTHYKSLLTKSALNKF